MTENAPDRLFTIVLRSICTTAPALVLLVPHTERNGDGIEMCEVDGRYNIHVRGMTNGDGVDIGAVAMFLRHVADHITEQEDDGELLSS